MRPSAVTRNDSFAKSRGRDRVSRLQRTRTLRLDEQERLEIGTRKFGGVRPAENLLRRGGKTAVTDSSLKPQSGLPVMKASQIMLRMAMANTDWYSYA
jgi:hypothetical protein